MNLFRFHHRKLCIIIVVGVTLVLLVASRLGPRPSTHSVIASDDVVLHNSIEDISRSLLRRKIVDKPQLSHRKTVDREAAVKLNILLNDITQESTCPVCLGADLCEDVSTGFLSLKATNVEEQFTSSSATVYLGNIGVQHPVLLQVPNAELYSHTEEALCGHRSPCDVKTASILWPYVTSVHAMSTSLLTKYMETLGETPLSRPLMMCSSSLSVSVLEAAFTTESVSAGSGVPTPSDKLNLLTAVSVAPGYALHKMAGLLQLNLGMLSIIGSCGRTWVTNGEELTPLTKLLLTEDWGTRAAVGAQLLTIVADMLEGSEEWVAVVTQWKPEHLAITKDGELILYDTSHVTIIDRTVLKGPDLSAEDDPPTLKANITTKQLNSLDEYNTLGVVCNTECMEYHMKEVEAYGRTGPELTPQNMRPGFTRRTGQQTGLEHELQPDTTALCTHEDFFAHLMYASICAYVLSDDPAHMGTVILKDVEPREDRHRGLLHSPPDSMRAQLEQLLEACVVETAPGDRLRTVERLREKLGQYGGLDDDDDDGYDAEDYESDDEGEELNDGEELNGL